MRGILDRYVRSLREREIGNDAPEKVQDLGTFVDWLLHREGFKVIRRPFYDLADEGMRTKKSGVLEHGIDIVAVCPNEKRVYRFVLKQGDVTQASWGRQGRGSLFDDLKKAAALPPSADQRHAPNLNFDRFTIVAVHNGDRRDEVRELIQGEVDNLKRGYVGVENVEWWDADELVCRALAVGVDEDLLPPETRPFVRLVVDSLAKEPGGRLFDYRALDLAIDAILPTKECSQEDSERQISELALVVSLIDAAAQKQDVTVPVLDTVERVICRILQTWSHATKRARQKAVRAVLCDLLDVYVSAAGRLLKAIEPFATEDYGLAVTPVGDVVGYPLRSLRFCGYLALAGLIELERDRRPQADEFAVFLAEVFEHNPGGCLSPVCDDQMIELGLVWQLWLRTGRRLQAARTAAKIVERLYLRSALGIMRPALWLRASVPPEETALRALLEGHLSGASQAQVEDGASTLLPLALYVAHRGGATCDPDWLKVFLAESGKTPLYAEVWVPPPEAPESWYSETLLYVGVCHVVDLTAGVDGVADQVEALASPVQKSAATRLRLPALDWLAFKRWRNLPPLNLFVSLLR